MTPTLPLSDLTVLVTRSAHQAPKLSDKLTRLGAKVIEMAVISIQPPDSYDAMDKALAQLSEYDWVVFASVNAVEFTLDRFDSLKLPASNWQNVQIATIGPATTHALTRRGLKANFSPSSFVAENLVEEFPGYPTNLSGKRILWPRTNVGRTYLMEKLQAAGAVVTTVAAYKTMGPEDPEGKADQLIELLSQGQLDAITLMSAQTARNLSKLLHLGLMRQGLTEIEAKKKLQKLLAGPTIATIGPETTLAAKTVLPIEAVEARTFTSDGLIEAISDHFVH